MKRYQLFEFHELERFPILWRNLITDFLSFFAHCFRPYGCVSEHLWDAVDKAGAANIVDLCSGAAKPILTVKEAFNSEKKNIPIIITDKFPNKSAFEEIEKEGKGEIKPVYSSVDATDVPPELDGFRTIFTAFHHFGKKQAQQVIVDAIYKNQGIGIFEYTERRLLWGFYALNIPWVVLLCTPFIKPFSWSRIFFTYVIPVIPVFLCIDGAVSCLRTYSPQELKDIIEDIESEMGGSGYEWEIGQAPSMLIMRITYLIGYPAK